MNYKKAVKKCSEVYGFSYEESMRMLEGVKREIVLPYSGEVVGNCGNLCKNGGLYTQCESLKIIGGEYCVSCESKISKCGIEYGTVSMRKECDVMLFKDVKGNFPVHYTKVMKKNNLSKEMVLEECNRRKVSILEEHLVEPVSKRGRPSSNKEVKEKKAKGRPSKSKKVVELETDTIDLFANLIKNATMSKVEEKVEEKVEAKIKKEKAKAEKEQEKIKKEQEKEKADKEKAKEQEKIKKEKTKEQEKIKKEKTKEQDKIKKEQEKEQEKKTPNQTVIEQEVTEELKEDEYLEDDSVVEFEYLGKKYLRTITSNVVYNMEEDEIGVWNEKTKSIDLSSDSEEEDE